MRALAINLCLIALPALLTAQDIPNPEFLDSAVIPYFHKVDPRMIYFQTFHRKVLDDRHTLLLVRGGAFKPGWTPSSLPMETFWWTEGDLLGLFLVEASDPSLVWQLAMIPNAPEDAEGEGRLEVDRVDHESVVLRVFVTDYGLSAPWLKIFFDINTKQFLGQVRYRPVGINQGMAMTYSPRVRGSPARAKNYFVGSFEGKPVVVARQDAGFVIVDDEEEQKAVLRFLAENPQRTPNWGSPFGPEAGYQAEYWDRSVQLLPIDFPPANESAKFYVSFSANEGRRVVNGILERTADGYKLYPFPQSPLEEHRRLRPERDEQQGREINWTIEENVGPFSIFPGSPPNPRTGEREPPRFWFAKTFYDGEGYSGVGGVGYFDTDRMEYVIFSPPELAPWSTSALMLGANDTLWVGLYRQPEGADYSGGLLHFDPATGNARVYDVKEIITLIYPGPTLSTTNGIYTLRDEKLERFVIEPDLVGKLQIIASPPPE